MSKGRSEKSRQGRANRAKGIRAELEVCQLINSLIPGVTAKRHLSQWRERSQQDIEGVEGWMIQVKYAKSLSAPAWWKALEASAREKGLQPALWYRKPNEPWRVLVRMEGEGAKAFETTLDVWAELVIARRRLGERPWAASDVLG